MAVALAAAPAVLATAQQTIGIVVALLVVAGWGLYLLANIRRARPETGSEVELAPNRKPYLDDEQLEGRKLEGALGWGLVCLTIVGVGLPLYWLAEPGRQSGAIDDFQSTFEHRGAELFATTEAGGFNCAGCHGGMNAEGGVAPYVLTENVVDEEGNPLDEEGNPVEGDAEADTQLTQVQWQAPALNTVFLRYSEAEVLYILRYGRPFSPMPAWGIEGGGPMNEQQLENLVDYMQSIQIDPKEARAQAVEEFGESDGAALFDGFCARCHTLGYSYGQPSRPGSGAFGPNLTGGVTERQFPLKQDHIDFVTNGAEDGAQYGVQGQSRAGMMPGFGGMLTEKQIEAIVEYERSL